MRWLGGLRGGADLRKFAKCERPKNIFIRLAPSLHGSGPIVRSEQHHDAGPRCSNDQPGPEFRIVEVLAPQPPPVIQHDRSEWLDHAMLRKQLLDHLPKLG